MTRATNRTSATLAGLALERAAKRSAGAAHVIRGPVRRKPLIQVDVEDAPEPTIPEAEQPDVSTTRADLVQAIRAAVAELPEALREVIEMRWFSEERPSRRLVGEVLGVCGGTVLYREKLAFEALREALTKRGLGPGLPGE